MLKTGPSLAIGTYFVRNDRLYYVVDWELDTCNLLVENCSTLIRDWVTEEQLELDEVRVLRRRRGTREYG
jgi:hypothetical protein